MSERLQNWQQGDTEDRLQALLRMDSWLQPDEIQVLLDTAQQVEVDDILRIECWKVLGLYSQPPHTASVRTTIHEHWDKEQDEEYVQIAMLEALIAMDVQTEDVRMALAIVQSDEYILVRSAAFALLCHHHDLPEVRSALEQLRDDSEYGSSAVKLLAEQEG